MSSRDDTQEPARPRIYSEEDEEIRIAKAMALAIQNNPNMTPDEINQLTSDLKKQGQKVAQQHVSASATTPKTQDATTSPRETASEPSNAQDPMMPARLAAKLKDKVDGFATSPEPEAEKQKRRTTLATKAAKIGGKAKGKFKGMVVGTSSGKDSNTDTELSPTRSKTPPRTPNRTSLVSRSVSNPQPPPPRNVDMPVLQEEGGESSHSRASASSPPQEPREFGDAEVRLTGVLWKRRSGFGKLSAKHAWERRRVVLAGTKLNYFKSLAETEAEDDTASGKTPVKEGEEETLSTEKEEEVGDEPASPKRASWFEQAAANIEKAKDNFAGYMQQPPTQPPRGSLDLVKERALVAATLGHSGAPTPFCISIKVGKDTKWKFGFNTHAEQMEWLAALTDVVVQSSVDEYNAALVAAADPSVEPAFIATPAPLEPEHDEAEGHRLWMIDNYNIKCASFIDGPYSDGGVESGEDDVELDGELENEQIARSLSDTENGQIKMPEVSFALKGQNLKIMALLFNVALFYAHASSTGVSKFWYIVTFMNCALWSLIVSDEGCENLSDEQMKNLAVASLRAKSIKQEMVAKKSASAKKSRRSAKPAFKPVAGTTTMRIKETTDIPSKDGHIFAGWRTPEDSNMYVRSHGYLSTKEKVPSPGELYELAHVDIFESPNQFRDMSNRVVLPKVQFDDDGATKTWHAPDVFVISVALPTDPPKMGRSADDGGGYTITMYYTMKKTTREILRRVTAIDYDPSSEVIDDVQKSQVNAVKLLNTYCRRAPTDPKFQARFKLVATVQNLKEIGMPGWIAKYNGKPVLIKRAGQTGFLYNHPEHNVMEFDISFHPFPYLAKQAICYLKDNMFKKVLVTFGFVIEGRSDDELPECLIGGMQLCYPDPIHAIQAHDFFAGTSPKSF